MDRPVRRILTALALVAALMLPGCFPWQKEPSPREQAYEELQALIEGYEGVTPLEGSHPLLYGSPLVRAESVEVARQFAGAFEALIEERQSRTWYSAVGIGLDVPGGTSLLRYQAGETPDEVWQLLGEPLLGGATARLIGIEDIMPIDPHYRHPQTSFHPHLVYVGGDVLQVFDDVQTIEGFRVMVVDSDYPDVWKPDNQLGTLDHHYPSELDDVRGHAEALRRVREAGFHSVRIRHDSLTLESRGDVLAAADLLPADTPVGLGTDGELTDDRVSIAPTDFEFYEYGSPTRREVIDWFKAHPEATGGTGVRSLSVNMSSTADCDAFLASPPPWNDPLDFSCVLDSGLHYAVERPMPELLRVAPIAREAAEIGEARVVVMGQPTIIAQSGPDLARFEDTLAKIREIGWEGEMKISLMDRSTGKREAHIEITSTDTGRGVIASKRPGGRPNNDKEQRLIDAWDASAE